MLSFATLIMLTLSKPCVKNDDGRFVCPLKDGKKITLISSVFDFTDSECLVNDRNVVRCTNVRIYETEVRVNLVINYDKESVSIL